MKEGQYYMTPLFMVCMPLIFITLFPGIELNLFYSLVPITGVALLLRALIMGNYDVALRYFLPVMVPTLVYAAIALRWAIDQFQREDVLFREAEQINLYSWFRHLFRDREPQPTGGQATLCFALIMTASWFLLQYLLFRGATLDIRAVIAGQLMILIPPLIMAILLTSRPASTLRIAWPQPRYIILAVALVVSLNPLVNELKPLVEWLFPISSVIKLSLSQVLTQVPSLAMTILVFALATGDLRGIRISRLHSFRARARAPNSIGDPAFSLDVWVSPRAAFAFPAALQRHAPGDRAGAACRAQPQHPTRPDLPFPEQRDCSLTGIPDEGLLDSIHHPLDLSQAGGRALSCWVDGNKRFGLGGSAVLPVEAEVRAIVWGGAFLRRGTLTLKARYVLPVEGSPIEDACLTIERGRIAWVGPADERDEDLDLGNVAIVPGFVNAHTHLELEPIASEPSQGRDESEIPWLRRVIDQRRGRTEEMQNETVARNIRSAIEAGTTFLADTTTAGLSWGPIAEAPLRALVFAELIGLKRLPRARSLRLGLAVAGFGSPRDASGRMRTARPQPACALQHVGLALSQGGRQQDAALDPPCGDARGASIAQTSRRAAAPLPGRTRRLGRRLGTDRSAAGRLRPPRRASQRRLVDRAWHVSRTRRLLAASARSRTGGSPSRRGVLPADSCPLRARAAPVPGVARTRRNRLPRNRQPRIFGQSEHSRRAAFLAPAETNRSRVLSC